MKLGGQRGGEDLEELRDEKDYDQNIYAKIIFQVKLNQICSFYS